MKFLLKLLWRLWLSQAPKLVIGPNRLVNGTGNPYIYYRENDYVAPVVAEWVFGDPDIDLLVYSHYLVVWMYPHDTEFIEPEKKSEILAHIENYIIKELKIKKYEIKDDQSWAQRVKEMIERGERLASFKDE